VAAVEFPVPAVSCVSVAPARGALLLAVIAPLVHAAAALGPI
jgi:hypothetical protein